MPKLKVSEYWTGTIVLIRKHERAQSANERPDNSASVYDQHRASVYATIKYGSGKQKSIDRRSVSFRLARFLHRLPHPLDEVPRVQTSQSIEITLS